MPAYTYQCPKCKAEFTRFSVPIRERNAQICNRPTSSPDDPCDGKLVREGVETTAEMKHNWGKWTD